MSWEERTLGEVITLKRGHDLPSAKRNDGNIPIVSSSGITGYHNEAKASGPGVVTGRYGTLGEVFYLEEDYWPLNTALYVIDFKGNDPRYISYFLKNALRDYKSDKAAVPGVDRNVLHKMKVQHPSTKIQKRIADILSAYDDLIENNRRRIVLLERAARELYREWFVRLRFPGHEHCRIVDGVPEGWERRTLGEVSPLKYGKALKADDRIPGEFPVYGSSGIVGTHIKAQFKGPGIIVGRKGTIGSVYWSDTDFCAIDTVYFVDPNSVSLYLYYSLLNTKFISTDVAVPGLNRDFAHSRQIMIPDRIMLQSFEDFILPMRTQISLLEKENQNLTKARDLLLPRLMDGRIAV